MRWPPIERIQDLANKFGTEERIRQFQSGELVLVDREEYARVQRIMAGQSLGGFSNGGITYALGIDVEAFLADWVRFYKEVFGLTVDVSTVRLPPFRPGFGWGVLGIPGITNEGAYLKSKERFGARKDTMRDLDQAIPTDERTAKSGPYVIWCRDTQEADPNLANLSADQIAKLKLRTMTFRERLLLGLWFHWKTHGLHLDMATRATLCSGSRGPFGFVPSVGRVDGELYISSSFTDDCDASFRAREVVEVGSPLVEEAA